MSKGNSEPDGMREYGGAGSTAPEGSPATTAGCGCLQPVVTTLQQHQHSSVGSTISSGCPAPQASPDPTITISITPTTGGQFDITVDKNETIENLKKIISKRLKVAKERICLLHRERQLRDGTLEENRLQDGSRLTLLPSVETGLLAQRPEQSVMQALESLSDSQVNDFLSGKAPLNLTMRLGDHMMLIQLQLSTVTPATTAAPAAATSTSTTTTTTQQQVANTTPAAISLLTTPEQQQRQQQQQQQARVAQLESEVARMQREAAAALATVAAAQERFARRATGIFPTPPSTPTNANTDTTTTSTSNCPASKQPSSPTSLASSLASAAAVASSLFAAQQQQQQQQSSATGSNPGSPPTTPTATTTTSSCTRHVPPPLTLPQQQQQQPTRQSTRNRHVHTSTTRHPYHHHHHLYHRFSRRRGAQAAKPTCPSCTESNSSSPAEQPESPTSGSGTKCSEFSLILGQCDCAKSSSSKKKSSSSTAQQTCDACSGNNTKEMTSSEPSSPAPSTPTTPTTPDSPDAPVSLDAAAAAAAAAAGNPAATLDTRALVEASRNLTQKLKQLSSEENAKRRQGAIIESMHHHGKGVYTGTFSGTLNPALQDRHGRPKRDISTIIHILNDLLCATPATTAGHYRYHRHPSATSSAPAAAAAQGGAAGGNSSSRATAAAGAAGVSAPVGVATQTSGSPVFAAAPTTTTMTAVGGGVADAAATTMSGLQDGAVADAAALQAHDEFSKENEATKDKMRNLRLVMEQRREKMRARRQARAAPYTTKWAAVTPDAGDPNASTSSSSTSSASSTSSGNAENEPELKPCSPEPVVA